MEVLMPRNVSVQSNSTPMAHLLAFALGATAVSALAVSALAIGRVAIDRVAIKKSTVRQTGGRRIDSSEIARRRELGIDAVISFGAAPERPWPTPS
jgi:hypothetical protein